MPDRQSILAGFHKVQPSDLKQVGIFLSPDDQSITGVVTVPNGSGGCQLIEGKTYDHPTHTTAPGLCGVVGLVLSHNDECYGCNRRDRCVHSPFMD